MKKILIPIYGAAVFVVVSVDPHAAMAKLPLKATAPESGVAWCSSDGANGYAVVFHRDHVNIDSIAHECFHLTHRILEHAGTNFDAEHHEHAAYLNGWLNAEVYKRVKRYLK